MSNEKWTSYHLTWAIFKNLLPITPRAIPFFSTPGIPQSDQVQMLTVEQIKQTISSGDLETKSTND